MKIFSELKEQFATFNSQLEKDLVQLFNCSDENKYNKKKNGKFF